MERKNAWEKYPKGKERQKVMDFAEEYRQFLSVCKTERECVAFFEEKAVRAGFENLETFISENKRPRPGDRIYYNYMGKAMALFVMGREGLENGMNILGAHIDSPRMDLKQVPLYEDTQMALLDTHYYGGIKKYQWVTLPLALHGVFVKKDGSRVKVEIGEKESDPVVGVSDLLVHLSADQLEKKGNKVVP